MPFQRLTYPRKGQKGDAIASLRRLFNFAFGKTIKGNDENASQSFKSQLANADYHLTARQMARIIEAGKSFRDQALLQMLAETGMRRSEVAGLNIEDIKWDQRLLFISQGKGMKTRLIPVTESLSESLAKIIERRNIGPVFESRNGNRLSLRQVNRIVADAGRRARVNNPNPKHKNITPHLFRHSFARLWKRKGGSIETLSKIMGHSSVRTTWDFYGKEGLEDMRRNYRRIMRELPPGNRKSKRGGVNYEEQIFHSDEGKEHKW